MARTRDRTEVGVETLVDGHAHLRACFEVGPFLNGAYVHFRRVLGRSGSGTVTGALFLADARGEEGFERLRGVDGSVEAGPEVPAPSWELCSTGEASLVFSAGRSVRLVIVGGRQLVSREGLEVLAIGTRRSFPQHRPIAELIRRIGAVRALPVVPWGVGKWWGKRGKQVRALIDDPDLPRFGLGDSAHRPAWWPRPAIFRRAKERSLPILPGSDPLPFPEEVSSAGRRGFALPTELPSNRPAASLVDRLTRRDAAIRPFGGGVSTGRFVHNQLRMQLRRLVS